MGIIFAIPAVLPIFSSLAGGIGDTLSDFLIRIVLNYDNLIVMIFSYINDFLYLNLLEFRNFIAFSVLIGFSYIIRVRDMSFDGSYGEEKILSAANTFSFIFITNILGNNSKNLWLIAINSIVIASYFLLIVLKSHFEDPEYRKKYKIVVFSISIIIVLSFLYEIFYSYDFIGILPIFVYLISSIVYCLGLFTRVDGYYPFLYIFSTYSVFWVMNYLLKNVFPSFDLFLKGWGV
jgi:hypothetical protein